MTSDTDADVEHAYGIFARYSLGADLDFAAQIGLKQEERERLRRVLIATPVRELARDAVEAYFDYIDAAHFDGGFRANEFRHFLPRALDLLARAGCDGTTDWLRECLAGSFDRAAVRALWPAAEIEAVDRVFIAP